GRPGRGLPAPGARARSGRRIRRGPRRARPGRHPVAAGGHRANGGELPGRRGGGERDRGANRRRGMRGGRGGGGGASVAGRAGAALPPARGLLPGRAGRGPAYMTAGPAMSAREARRAVETGIETARDLVAAGNRCLITGDMGIANTTASAALIAVFTGAEVQEGTGRGTGIDDETWERKGRVGRRALARHHPDPADPPAGRAARGGRGRGP